MKKEKLTLDLLKNNVVVLVSNEGMRNMVRMSYPEGRVEYVDGGTWKRSYHSHRSLITTHSILEVIPK